MNKRKLKTLLKEVTGCTIQHNGWPCGSCFFAIDENLTNQDWQVLLFYRGDYKKEDLTNLPENIENNLNKIYQIAKKRFDTDNKNIVY